MAFQIWALLAKEAVLLGEFRAAGEYLSTAQKHNDAFHDRENVARLAQVCRSMPITTIYLGQEITTVLQPLVSSVRPDRLQNVGPVFKVLP